MRRLQLGLRGQLLVVDEADVDALVRATHGPAVGGFQRRARSIVVDAVIDRLRAQGLMPADPPAPRVISFRQRRLPFPKEPPA
jgi:hypothetical protein